MGGTGARAGIGGRGGAAAISRVHVCQYVNRDQQGCCCLGDGMKRRCGRIKRTNFFFFHLTFDFD